MSNPEAQGMPEKTAELYTSFVGLMRKMILEGVVDPNKGTQFTIIQSETTHPSKGVEQIMAKGSLVVVAGVPNPIVEEFDELVMDDEAREAKRQQAREEGNRLKEVLDNLEEGENDG